MWFIAFQLLGHLHTKLFKGVWPVKQLLVLTPVGNPYVVDCWTYSIIHVVIKPLDGIVYVRPKSCYGVDTIYQYERVSMNSISPRHMERAREGRRDRNPIVLSRRFETRATGQSTTQVSYINDNPFASQFKSSEHFSTTQQRGKTSLIMISTNTQNMFQNYSNGHCISRILYQYWNGDILKKADRSLLRSFWNLDNIPRQ